MSEILSRVGYGGVAVEQPLEPAAPHVVKAYLAYDRVARVRVRRVREALGHLRAFALTPIGELGVRRIAEEDWLEAWRAHYRPLVVGRFLIKPSWIDVDRAGHVVVELDPGMAFGTGLHPTTRQMLEALSSLDLTGVSVLDVGTGSGVLALAAQAAGAARVVAVDVDAVAVRVARENVARAAVTIEVWQGSAADVTGEFDVVLANIVARVIGEIAPHLRARTRRGGTLAVAGIIADAAAGTVAALEAAGFALVSRDVRGDWVALILR